MTCRPVERGACVIDLLGPICVPHMNCSLDDVAPVWALTCVIGQSLKERGEVGASGHVNVADSHSFPDSVRSGQLLRQLVHGDPPCDVRMGLFSVYTFCQRHMCSPGYVIWPQITRIVVVSQFRIVVVRLLEPN